LVKKPKPPAGKRALSATRKKKEKWDILYEKWVI